ncbi:bifunctional oligoribonuclease/PAP phosphatase NrnA [Agrilactobacillus yilanensis]|uniref:Bifunctional oligoribonuclease/PAP phosphatase NrnA n=1 Tax=Agrilactobacillus yilanensis TaxID=2485997 RepID=A0ABW4J5T7_9LACO|nr:bifunctional oligoribonuclease/PAP phosphatase NrnA [Agrilactobacillus yilanensis]
MTIFKDILTKIEAYETIIIHRHQSPDPDALGSQTGLASVLRSAFPQKKIYQVGGDVGDLDWIDTMDDIEDTVYQGALVIVCDTANTPRISDQRYDQGDFLIKIDHHPDEDHYGDLVYVAAEASSCSEIMVTFVNACSDKLHLTDDAARKFYAGIVGDTGRFLYPATSSETFKIAAELVTYDFAHSQVSQHMNEVTLPQAKLQSFVYENIQLSDNGSGCVLISQAVLQEMGITEEQAKAVVSTPGHLKGCLAWILAVQQPDGHYRLHLRSKGPVINGLAKAHHGGGHDLASGAKAVDQAEIQQAFESLQSLVADYKKIEGKH